MTILVGYAAKPEGDAAIRYGIWQAKLQGTGVRILHIADRSRFIGTEGDGPERPIVAELASSGVPYELNEYALLHPAAEELLKQAATPDVSLVVIGSRKRTAVGKLVIGSTAQQVIINSPKAVVSVKADWAPPSS